jgi:hypothetical protein
MSLRRAGVMSLSVKPIMTPRLKPTASAISPPRHRLAFNSMFAVPND